MKILRSVLLSSLLLFLASLTAQAQFSVYGTVGVTDYGTAVSGSSFIINGDFFGGGGGVTYIFPRDSRLTLGIDAREYVTPAIHGGSTGVASFRIGFVPHKVPLRPYFQLGGGYVSAKVVESFNPKPINIGAVGIGFGLDVPVSRHIDLRLPEVESTAGVSSAKSAGTASFAIGVVYHFRPVGQTKP
jgi:hypothetical protein